MKESFNIYVEKEAKESYKNVCKKIGIKPSLRIQVFIKNDLELLLNTNSIGGRNPLSSESLSAVSKIKEVKNVPFTITVDPMLREEYKSKCEELGTSASIRISAFIASDLDRLNTLLPSLLTFRRQQ